MSEVLGEGKVNVQMSVLGFFFTVKGCTANMALNVESVIVGTA